MRRVHAASSIIRGQRDGPDVDASLDTLGDIASGPRAGLVVELADHAIARIEKAIDDIDDSDGHCGELLERARDIHFQACRTAQPDPVALARDLFRRETQGAWDTFHDVASQYADVLGEAGLSEYRRLARAAWDKLPARHGPRREAKEHGHDISRLALILDFFAERDGDLETRIASPKSLPARVSPSAAPRWRVGSDAELPH